METDSETDSDDFEIKPAPYNSTPNSCTKSVPDKTKQAVM